MNFGVGGRVELIVLHLSSLHKFFSYPARTELDYVQLMTATIEPPEHQGEPHKDQPDRLAADDASNLEPIVFPIEWELTRRWFVPCGSVIRLRAWERICSQGFNISGYERRERRIGCRGQRGTRGCWYWCVRS